MNIEICKKCPNYPYYFILGNKDINKQKDFGKNEYFSYLKKHVKTHKKINSPNYVFVKNKIAAPYGKGSFLLDFEHGVDHVQELMDYSLELGIIIKKGPRDYQFNDNKFHILYYLVEFIEPSALMPISGKSFSLSWTEYFFGFIIANSLPIFTVPKHIF